MALNFNKLLQFGLRVVLQGVGTLFIISRAPSRVNDDTWSGESGNQFTSLVFAACFEPFFGIGIPSSGRYSIPYSGTNTVCGYAHLPFLGWVYGTLFR